MAYSRNAIPAYSRSTPNQERRSGVPVIAVLGTFNATSMPRKVPPVIRVRRTTRDPLSCRRMPARRRLNDLKSTPASSTRQITRPATQKPRASGLCANSGCMAHVLLAATPCGSLASVLPGVRLDRASARAEGQQPETDDHDDPPDNRPERLPTHGATRQHAGPLGDPHAANGDHDDS